MIILFQSQAGTRLRIRLEQLSLESSTGCIYDYLRTYDGHPSPITEDTAHRRHVCGYTIPDDEEFAGNTGSLYFQ